MKNEAKILHGFSKKSRDEKLEIIATLIKGNEDPVAIFKSFHHTDPLIQEMLEEFSENTVSNFYLPYSVVPNFLINGKVYMVPMVIEESSVVAAAANSAKFWFSHDGFKTEILGTQKIGQLHFIWKDSLELLRYKFSELKELLIESCESITENMRGRGGGILDIELRDLTHLEPGMMQLFCTFETVDSMGANFINSCLEQFSATFREWHDANEDFKNDGLDIVMCILSNLTPECQVGS